MKSAVFINQFCNEVRRINKKVLFQIISRINEISAYLQRSLT